MERDKHARPEEDTQMDDPARIPDSQGNTGDNTTVEPDRGWTTGTPRWVKVFGIIAIVLVLMFLIPLLSGRGHGPGRHAPSGGGGTTLSSVAEDHAPAEGSH